MTNPQNLTEDLPQLEEENPCEKKHVITEDLPQEDEESDPRLLTEDA